MQVEVPPYMTLEDKERIWGKKKVLMIGMGGTIAMTQNKRSALIPTRSVGNLIDQMPGLNETANIDILQLENKDSINLHPPHWKKICIDIADRLKYDDEYHGIIVAHGTDTMAYTASAVGIAMGKGLKRPIVFTGSQLPTQELGTDARFNLENAMKVLLAASDNNIAEVMITFSDKVLRATRAVKINESKFDAFASPVEPPIGLITANGVEFQANATKAGEAEFDPKVNFHRYILTLDVVPGLEPRYVESLMRNERVDGIVFKSSGGGNIPDAGRFSLIPVIREATRRQIPVLVATKFVGGKSNPAVYEPGRKALEAGAIPTGDMTDVMAEVKLMWLLRQQPYNDTLRGLKDKILTNYVGEITQSSNS